MLAGGGAVFEVPHFIIKSLPVKTKPKVTVPAKTVIEAEDIFSIMLVGVGHHHAIRKANRLRLALKQVQGCLPNFWVGLTYQIGPRLYQFFTDP